MSTRPWVAGAMALALVGVGAVIAWQVDKALGISFTPADVPPEDLTAAPPRPAAPAPEVAEIVAPDDQRVRRAAEAVVGALSERGVARPAVRATSASGGPALRVATETSMPSPEAFRLRRDGGDVVVAAADPAGVAAGLYAIADRIRSGGEVVPPGDDGRVIAPRLGLRLVDAGAVGVDADPAGFVGSADYSLNTDVVGPAIRPDPPYVDAAAVERVAAQFRQLVDHALALGYNGIVVPGFLEYVTLAGQSVYPPGDPHVARAEAMVTRFGPVWRYAHEMGMKVYFQTDMLALSPPLRRHLEQEFGRLATEDNRLWTVYQAALRELFTALPYAAGLMIRIGEGGDVYQFPGWDYTSEIAVKTPAAVRAMLAAFLRVAGEADRDIILRTWSIGVGAVGDLHIDPASYEQVLGGIDDPHLIVSTKYCLGDFYSHLPFNHTLEMGTQRRIVEFQARREFEVFGALPNDLGVLQQQALQRFLAANPRVEGVWTWTQGGGPLRAGPRTLYLRAGFWQLYELNVYSAARLAWNPDADPAQITADWARQTFATDPSTVAAIGQAMALSRQAVMQGLYIGPYASRTVKALGVAPPPMMWIFEWDIVTGDSAVLDSIYSVSRDRLDEAIRDGDEAVELTRRMRALVAGTDPATWRDPVLRQHFVDTLDYQVDLFETLSAYRTMFLRYAEWLDTGAADARAAWQEARVRYAAARDGHLRRYEGNVDLPAFRFPAADLGLQRADRDLLMAWLARGLLALLVVALVFWRGPGAGALRALRMGAFRPWRVGPLGLSPTRADRVLVWAIPAAALVLSRSIHSWFAAPAHLVLVLGAWLIFGILLRLLVGGADPFALWAAVGGAALLRTVVLLSGLATRGPGGYWFTFWTDPPARSGYIAVAFAAFLWVFAAGFFALRGYGIGRSGAAGRVLVAAGAPVVGFGALVSGLGLERALTIWNDQMALLPWGMSRILGITVFLDIPTSLPLFATLAGAALTALGALLAARSPMIKASL